MKEDKTIAGLFGVFLTIFILNCSGGIYRQLAISNPSKLVSIEDSLLQTGPTTHIISSVALAHEVLGDSAMRSGDYEKAKKHFTKALKFAPNDTLYMYNQLMAEGHLLQKSGKKNKLWSSIQVYNKAATTFKKSGAPYYYIGKSYHKLGDKDFDLIIESYDKALALELSTELRRIVNQAREDVIMREKNLREFWK